MENKQLLTQTVAVLLCTTPETPLGKLLNFCLAAKVDANHSGKTPWEFAQELISHPETLSSWISDVIDSDNSYSVDEMIALSEMQLSDVGPFMQRLFDEADAMSIGDP